MKEVNNSRETQVLEPALRLVAWEITGRCNLFCAHCRASAGNDTGDADLPLGENLAIVDMIAEIGHPIIILSGGEPLIRQDIFDIAKYAHERGLKVVLGSNGTLITEDMANKIKEAFITRVAVSLDFPTAEGQDNFRGQGGAFEAALNGITNLQRSGIEVQINTTISRLNIAYIEELLSLAIKLGAVAFHPFFLVPTGRGHSLADQELSPHQYEDALNWIYDQAQKLSGRIFIKPTDAPHYFRVLSQRKSDTPEPMSPGNLSSLSRGCLCGTGFCFISHSGEVKGCGYLDIAAGNLREQTLSRIWYESPLFNDLRHISNIEGKCGRCEYKLICGGCRARAYELTGNYMASEPYCIYQPKKTKNNETEQH